MSDEFVRERFSLLRDRICEIPEEDLLSGSLKDYMAYEAAFFRTLFLLKDCREKGVWAKLSIEEKAEWNGKLYQDILEDNYGRSYGNPSYACRMLGNDLGGLAAVLYDQIRGGIVFVFEDRLEELTALGELFLQIYGELVTSQEEAWSEQKKAAGVEGILADYIRDYCDDFVQYRVRELVDPSLDFFRRIIMEANLADPSYLYDFGEYIGTNEGKLAEFLFSLSEEEIYRMALVWTEGYRQGFIHAGIDLSKKKTVNIQYPLGFERVVRQAILLFEEMGLEAVVYRPAAHLISRRGAARNGCTGSNPNRQYFYDHRGDAAVYLSEDMAGKKLRALQNGFEKVKDLARGHAGPAVMETFGEEAFSPAICQEAVSLSDQQQKIQVHIELESGQITNRYIIGSERSFTIIAWPLPAIGEKFEEIFRETMKLNTLDSKTWEKIHQYLIDALDQGDYVHVLGKGENQTDIRVSMQKLEKPKSQTLFENCVADVNIPVGEVFTSPQLTGTEGRLHVSRVYLEGLEYRNLYLDFKDGQIIGYGCGNFKNEEEGREYIRENLLHRRDSLPLGEFAIGTNTTAYVMAGKYDIADRLPILIAEKTGPHFAVGDTCYSWAEDTPVFNPDGKEIIARDNELSIQRKTDPSKAYVNCHTDITIPYEELGSITVVTEDRREIHLIRDGRFVLAGTEELNRPLEEREEGK